ncbi:WD40/YVTN/BNR-like repeat-containing protein [candidate division KSB1 bacterium]
MKPFIRFTLVFLLVFISADMDISAIAQDFDEDMFNGLRYRNIGPSRGGRVTTVAGVSSQPNVFYMGATGGGVWKTEDYGQSWRNISDGYFETGSIGAIRVAPNNPDIIYVGTGSDGIRSNVITGRGIYKSSDAGRTWEFIGLRDTGQIGSVEVHPTNPDIVFVAALGHAYGPNRDRGVYRSKDGGSTWERVFYLSEDTGAIDLELAPDNPDEIYVGMWHGVRQAWTIISGNLEGGLFKSSDGGDTWNKMTTGLPTGIFGKSDLAVSKDNPDRVYALIEALEGSGFYLSEDRGRTFRLVSSQGGLLNRPFYYCNIDADPSNADVLYVNTGSYYKSSDGGRTWQTRSTPHGDNHDMWINPNDSNLFIQSNDGGANVTRDGGQTWSTQNNQPTAEIYQVAVDDQFPYWVYGGQQDNSTIMVPSAPPYSTAIGPTAYWRAIGGCETGPAVPKPGNHNIVFANCKGRFGVYNKITGQEKQYYVGAANMYGHNPKDLKYRFQRVSPIHVSPHDPDIVYHASQYLHKTTDDGVTWETISPDLTAFESDKQVISGSPITRDITGEEFYSTIYAIQESPVQRNLIWVGANDGPVHVTRDGGRNWENVTPNDIPSGGRVQTIEPSPHLAGKAYFAAYRYLCADDYEPYIYKTEDYGQTWTRITNGRNGIPIDSPTRVIREDPYREGLLYAGTEFGMYISFDDGKNWQSFQQNLPATPITDIKIYREDMVLSTMGRSFWIMDNLTPLHQMNSQVRNSDFRLYEPKTAYRFRGGGGRGGGSGPEYPRTGAVIDFYFADQPSGRVTLEILDSGGELVRSYSNQPSSIVFEAPSRPGIQEFDTRRGAGLNVVKGNNRFIWDLSHSGSWSAPRGGRGGRGGGGGRSGPMAVPGNYTLKLTAGGRTQTVELELLADPRVAESGITQAIFTEQLEFSLKIRDMISNANLTLSQLNEARQKFSSDRAKMEKLDALYAKMVTSQGTYQTPMLMDQMNYLNSMLGRADQKPGNHAYIRYEELYEILLSIIEDLNDITG